ncbi:hypothetical protein FZEAL_1074 [Fusarium zealandicum]|uniref:Uncharacterized protein n=1 Tax=Fusarium zealandicum TaxID=1053134 RepID=A0A8H4UUA1_9HYPO|nr:hypothetical protein FZEAL_1074 [Fusarium zealandicum]
MCRLLSFGLAFSILVAFVHCETEFIRPAGWDDEIDNDVSYFIRHAAGSKMVIKWETDQDEITLYLTQKLSSGILEWYLMIEDTTQNQYGWPTVYDPASNATDNEDVICGFALYEPVDGDLLAQSRFFNISAPESDSTTTSSVSTIGSTSATAPISSSTTVTTSSMDTEIAPTESSTSQDTSSDSGPGLSGGATAGIGAGATLGGLLVLGGVGFLLWKRHRRRSKDSDMPAELPGQV